MSKEMIEQIQIAVATFIDHNPPIFTIERNLFDLVFSDGWDTVAFESGYAVLRPDGRVDLVKK